MNRVQCIDRGVSNGTEEAQLSNRRERIMRQENLYEFVYDRVGS